MTTATRPKANSEAALRKWIAERPDEDPPADLLGEHLPEYARRKSALLQARRKAAAEYAEGQRLMREAESIPELSREARHNRPSRRTRPTARLHERSYFSTDSTAPCPTR